MPVIIYGGKCGIHDHSFRGVAEDVPAYLGDYVQAALVQPVGNGVFMLFIHDHDPFPMSFQVLCSESDERFVFMENPLSLEV